MCAGSKQAVLSVDAAASAACANRHDARHSVAVFAAGAAVAVAMGIDTADARRWGQGDVNECLCQSCESADR